MTTYELLKFCAGKDILEYREEFYRCYSDDCNKCEYLGDCIDLYQDDSAEFTIEEVNKLKEEYPEYFL